ncbi:MAG TPA: hypothetical protein PKD20_00235 [Candidatus Saccharibacteria bacterium]|nr:hypothetical protein [Candidatus Saccharibacteria bacterium]HMT55284.1 hypothetical protein [Candidatus Saccharibacteria bacterium]
MQNPALDQVTKALKEANNVLVTVKNGPTVDELAAAIALTLVLNHMNKHAITVFSGRVPSMLEFLQPEMAIDTNTDSLRDFIIALDKSKADKLRYKVEDNVVRIFITPYKTSISEKDLEFSQGDFNVDVVVGLGVVSKEDFDQAVTTHGRILHDAKVIALTNHNNVSHIGAINWQESQASSISEMVARIVQILGEDLIDPQVATALMTGIVAETDRFRNNFTTPEVMTLSARLMSAGANQQLIAEKLEEPVKKPVEQLAYQPEVPEDIPAAVYREEAEDGSLHIAHEMATIDEANTNEASAVQQPEAAPQVPQQIEPVDTYDPYAVAEAASFSNDFTQSSVDSSTHASYMPPTQMPTLYAQDDSDAKSVASLLEDSPGVERQQLLTDTNYPHEPALLDPARRKVIQPLPDGADHGSYGHPFIPPADMNHPVQPMAPMPAPASFDSAPVAPSPMPLPTPVPNEATLPPMPLPQPQVPAADNMPPVVPMPDVPPMPPMPEVSAASNESPQTLSDLERSVHSPHTQQVDDFLGTTRQPVDQNAQSEPNKQEEQKEDEKEEKPEPVVEVPQPAPKVVNPSAPPEVPPPLMPAPTQPQFFDADGNNNNPFLNPS